MSVKRVASWRETFIDFEKNGINEILAEISSEVRDCHDPEILHDLVEARMNVEAIGCDLRHVAAILERVVEKTTKGG